LFFIEENSSANDYASIPQKILRRYTKAHETIPEQDDYGMDHMWFFFSIIVKSLILESKKTDKKGKNEDRWLKNSPDVYSYTACFLIFSSIYVGCNTKCDFSKFMKEIGNFFVSLWTLGNRGSVNELLLYFLILLSPDCRVHQRKKRMDILNLLFVFWKVIIESEHFIPLSYMSGKVRSITKGEFR
jgi:hypothetical protein